jgi:PAS domain S-box-containing protein
MASLPRELSLVLFEFAPDAQFLTDGDGVVREANQAAEELLGVSRSYLLGKPLGVFFQRTVGFRATLTEAARGEHLRDRELRMHRRDAGPRDVSVTVSALAEQGANRLLWVIRDVTERKRSERELTALKRDLEKRVRQRTRELEQTTKAKDELLRELQRRARVEREFVTNAAHELRTPLTAMVSALEVLEAGAKDVPEERDRFLGHLADQCARLHRLTHSLLLLARAQMGQEPVKAERVALAPLLADVAAELRTTESVSVEVECPDGLAVLANKELLQHAVANVAANAAKYVERGRISLAGRRDGGQVRVEVVDTGPGIAPEHESRAFERFYRGHDIEGDGFGLGLAIAKQAIERQEGEISLESKAGMGTKVSVTLPAADER